MKKILFTPGPVMMFPETIDSGAVQIPYFRNDSFSEMMLSIEATLLALVSAPVGSRAVFITGSGTAGMEAAVLNFVPPDNLVAVVNGGTFGQRFVDICDRHKRNLKQLKVDRDSLSDGSALRTLPGGLAALLVTAHETSIGHLYDLQATSRFCKEHDCLHIVDAISLFGTDPLNMMLSNIDVLIISSNKGLALAPGLALLVLSPKALERIIKFPDSYYFDVNTMLTDGLRGQTPFTPAIGILLQLEQRLKGLLKTGLQASIDEAAKLAEHFRSRIACLPLRTYSQSMPNAMTALELLRVNISARTVVDLLDRRYGLVVAANGGDLSNSVFRVSHMGNITPRHLDLLIGALTEILN